MVSTRRRVISEQDRFGGYNIQPVAQTSLEEPRIDAPEEDIMLSPRRRAESEIFAEKEAPILTYSSRPSIGRDEFVGASTVSAPKRVVKQPRREREDLMPSIKTQAYAAKQDSEQEKLTHKASSKINAKTKMTLVLYMIVVTVLAIVVIATGIAVSSINSDVNALESDIVSKNKIVFQQNEQVDKLTDKVYIAGKALENGMEKVDSVVEIDLVPFSDTMIYKGKTNAFDRFCEWVSNIIGG